MSEKLGELLCELEVILDKMIDDHGLQAGDIYGLVRSHLEVHRPDCIEEYVDGTQPVFYYGHEDGIGGEFEIEFEMDEDFNPGDTH